MKRLAGWGALVVLMGAAFTGCSDDDGDSEARDKGASNTESTDIAADADASGDDATGDDGATRTADESEFCGAMNDFYGVLGQDDAKGFEQARTALVELGAPAVIADSAGEGYQVFIDLVGAMDPADVTLPEDSTADEQKALATFGDAYFKLCMDATDSEEFGEPE
ncbi:hypothetical protein ACLM5J_04105 [Nocardioides sp. Bht2]|uniref:hypothetical protein n=1 Tax=Nocardioides sp. Bht2 TaxID=3392297 RepID=UPI0039B36F84